MPPPPTLALRPHPDGRRTCPYCRAALGEDEPTWECPGCGVGHHAECASENTKCAIHGCGQPAPVVARSGSGRIKITLRPAPTGGALPCAACRSGIAEGELAWLCPACDLLHHDECAQNLGRCASCGRLRNPVGARPHIEREVPGVPLAARAAGLALSLVFLYVSLTSAREQPGWIRNAPSVLDIFFAWVGTALSSVGAAASLSWGSRPIRGCSLLVVFAIGIGVWSAAPREYDPIPARLTFALVTAVFAVLYGLKRGA